MRADEEHRNRGGRALAAVAFAVGVFVGVRSIPDVRRYVEMRRM